MDWNAFYNSLLQPKPPNAGGPQPIIGGTPPPVGGGVTFPSGGSSKPLVSRGTAYGSTNFGGGSRAVQAFGPGTEGYGSAGTIALPAKLQSDDAQLVKFGNNLPPEWAAAEKENQRIMSQPISQQNLANSFASGQALHWGGDQWADPLKNPGSRGGPDYGTVDPRQQAASSIMDQLNKAFAGPLTPAARQLQQIQGNQNAPQGSQWHW